MNMLKVGLVGCFLFTLAGSSVLCLSPAVHGQAPKADVKNEKHFKEKIIGTWTTKKLPGDDKSGPREDFRLRRTFSRNGEYRVSGMCNPELSQGLYAIQGNKLTIIEREFQNAATMSVFTIVQLTETALVMVDAKGQKLELYLQNREESKRVRCEQKQTPAEEIRAKYAKQSAKLLQIVEPVKVSEVFYYKDGGTIGIVLADAKGKKHAFCLDGRFLPKEDPNANGPRNLFIGATHPTKAGAKKVAVGGPEESALYGVMLRWADAHPQRLALYNETISLDGKEFGNLWEVRSFFLRLDRRFVQP